MPELTVESRRLASGGPAQRQVLYLGEINDSQEAAWRKTISVFDEDAGQSQQFALFPADRPIPADEANALALAITKMRSRRRSRWWGCRRRGGNWPG